MQNNRDGRYKLAGGIGACPDTLCVGAVPPAFAAYDEHFLLGEFGIDWGGIFSLES